MATDNELEEKNLSNPDNQETVRVDQHEQDEETNPKGTKTPQEGVPLPSYVPNVFAKELKEAQVPDPYIHEGVNVKSFLEYTGSDINLLTDDAETIRARNQPWYEQAAGFANQAILGQIVGGTIESLGYLLDVPGMYNLYQGEEEEWGNWFSDIGKGIREFTQESTPIYQENPGTFNPGDPGWWFGNGVSVFSTLSLMIPSGLGLKGLQLLGRGVGSIARTTNIGARAMNAGNKLAKGIKTAGKFSDDIAKGMTQATLSRYMENMMESSQFFEEKYQDLIDKGIDEETARQRASEGAASVFKWDSAMLLQDMLQYTLLHRFTGGKPKAITPNNAGKAVGDVSTRLPGGRYTALMGDMIGEGAEEAYQYVAQEEAGYISDVGAGLREESTFAERLQNYKNDGELWTSAMFGALGAGLMQTVGPAIMERLNTRTPGFTGDPESFMENYMTQMSILDQSARGAEAEGNQRQADDIRDLSVMEMALKNAQMGTEQGALNELKSLSQMSDEELDEFVNKMSKFGRPVDPESIRKNASRHFDIAQRTVNKFKEIRDDYGNDVAYNASRDYMVGMLNKDRAERRQQELNDYKTNSKEYQDYQSKEEIDLEIQVQGLQKAKDQLNKLIDEFNEDEQIATKYQVALDNINENLETAKSDLKKRKNKEYQGEKKDKQRRKGLDPFINKASDIEASREMAEQVSNVSLNSYDEKINIANDKEKKQEKKEQAERKQKFDKETIPSDDQSVPKRGTPLKYKGENYHYDSSYEQDGETIHKIIKDGADRTDKTLVKDEDFQKHANLRKSQSTVADEAEEDKDTKQSREEQAETSPFVFDEGPEQDLSEKSKEETKEDKTPEKKTNDAQERAQGQTGGDQDIMVPENPDRKSKSDPHAESTPAQQISKTSTLAVATASIRNPQSHVRQALEAGEITENSERWKDAKAFTEWAENQKPITNSDGSYRYYVVPEIDMDYLKSSGDFSSEFIELVEKGKQPTPEVIERVPIRLKFYTQNNERVAVNDRHVSSFLHTYGYFNSGNFAGENLQQAKDKLFDQRAAIYAAHRHSTKMKAPVVEQTDGHFMQGEQVELGDFNTYNNIRDVLGKDNSEDVPLAIFNGVIYTGADGKVVPELSLREVGEDRAGAVYSHVVAANGKIKPLRLFVDNINREEADILYDAYSSMIRDTEATPRSVIPTEIKERIRTSEDPRINNIPEAMNIPLNDITHSNLIDFLVYEGENVTKNKGASALYKDLRNDVLYFGTTGEITREDFNNESKREVFYEWVSNNRRRQVTRRLISSPGYKRYLIDNNIVATTVAITEDGNPLMGASTLLGQFSPDSSINEVDGVQNSNQVPPFDVDDQVEESNVNWSQLPEQLEEFSSEYYQWQAAASGQGQQTLSQLEDGITNPEINLPTLRELANELLPQEVANLYIEEHGNTTPLTEFIETPSGSGQEAANYVKQQLGDQSGDTGMGSILQKPEISSNETLPSSMSQRGLIRTLDRLEEKFNVPYQIIDDPNIRWAGKLEEGIAFINTAHATEDTPFHEYAHPLLQSIKNTNAPLYMNLAQELQKSPQGREIYKRVRKAYSDLNNEQMLDEAIVQLFGELAANNVRQDQTGLKALLQRMWNYMKRLMNRLLNADIAVKEQVEPIKLDPSMTMQSISEILSDELSTIDLSAQRMSAEQRRPRWVNRDQYNDWVDFMTYMFVKSNTNADISDLEGANLTTIRDLVKAEIKYLEKNDPDSRFLEQYQRVLDEITVDGNQLNPESLFLNGVKKKLRTFGIRPDQEVDIEERDSRLNIQANYELSNKEKASTNVKLMLGMIPQLNSNDMVMNKFARAGEPKPDYKISPHTGLPKMHNFSEMWNIVQGALKNTPEIRENGRVQDIYRVQIEKLQQVSTLRPELKFLINHLENSPEYKQSQFSVVMSMVDQGFISALFRSTDNGFKFTFGRSDTQSVSNQILNHWASEYRNKLVDLQRIVKTGERRYIVNKDKAKDLVGRYDNILSTAKEANKNPRKFDVAQGQIPKELKQEVVSLLNDTGITISERTIDKVLADHGVGNTPIAGLVNMLRNTRGNSIRFLYKKSGSKADTGLSLEAMIESPKIIPANEEVKPPILNEQFIEKLAEAESYFQNQLIDNTILGPDNKPFWIYSQFNSMFKQVAEWKRSTESLQAIMSTAYGGNSKWGEWLLEDQEHRDSFEIKTLASIRQQFSSDIGKKNTELGFTDLVAIRVNAMLNGIFALPARADNTTEYYVQGPELTKGYRVSENNTIEPSDEAVNTLKDYLLDEIARVKHAENQVKKLDDKGNVQLSEDEWIKDYHYKLDENGDKDVTLGNAFKIDILPSFSFGGSNAHHIFKSDGETKTLTAQNFYNNPQVDNAIRQAIADQTKRDLKKLKDHRIITRDPQSNNTSDLENQAIDADILDGYKGQNMSKTAAIHAAVMDYTVNGIVANHEWHKLFGGDIASYKSREDFQKRATGPGSTGVNHRIMGDMKPTYNSAVISDIIQPSEILDDKSIKEIAKYTGKTQKEVRKLLAPYKNVDRADAQAWITIDQYRDRMRGYAKWTPKHEQAYRRLKEGNSLPSDTELFMQPLKTVHTESRVEGKNLIFHYNKQSEAVLHPMLVNTFDLGNLLEAMEANQVDHVVVESGKKVGARGITSITNEDGNIKQSSDIELNPVSLSKRFIFLQQELPTKGMNPIKEGSQLRKNILEGIQPDQTYELSDGTKLKGDEFLTEMHRTLGSLSDKGIQEVKDIIDWNEDASTYSQEKLYDILLDSMTVREQNENLVNALRQKFPLDAIPQMRISLENQLASIIKKRAVDTKHQTGGAYIQTSDFGWKTTVENTSQVRYINEEAKNGLKPPRVENGKFKPGQILLPHKIAKELNIDQLSDAELKQIFSKINTGISYRIPNQAMASNDVVEIVGILPPEMGDSVVAYKEVTTKFGSDFDIDKLTVMLPNYYVVDGQIKVVDFKDIDTNDAEQLKQVYKDQYQPKKNFLEYLRKRLGETRANMLKSGIDVATYFESKNDEDIIIDASRDVTFRDYKRIQRQVENMPSEEEFVDKNLGKSVYEINSKEAIQNRKLDLYRSMLSNPNTFMKMITALETDWLGHNIKLRLMVNDGRITQEQFNEGLNSSERAEQLIEENYEINYRDLEAYSPTTQAEIRKTFADTKAAVGQVANHVTDHPLAQHANLYLNRKDKKGKITSYYIGIGNSIETENGPATSFAGQFDETGEQSIVDTLSAFLTANVDAAKDPYITDGNFNLFTNPVALFLTRAGVRSRDIVDFIGSRSIRDFAKITAEYEGRTAQKYRVKGIGELTALQYVTYKYSNKDTTDITEAVDIEEVDPRQVIDNLRGDTNRVNDLEALALFVHLNKYASALGDSIQASKADVNGMGSSITSATVQQNIKDKVSEEGIIGNFERKFDGTFLERYHENSITEGINLFGKGTFLSFTKGHKDLIEEISSKIGMNPITSEDIAFKLNAEAYAYIMSGSDFAVDPDKLMDMFKGDKSMAQRLMRIKGSSNEDLRNNPLIEYLGVRVSANENELDFVYGQGSKKLTPDAQNEITEGWRELLNHDMKVVREFALDLGKYAYYTSGFRRNLTSFHELIPVELNSKLGVKDHIERLQLDLEDDGNPLASATDQILKNLQYDGSIVPNLSLKSPNLRTLGNMSKKKIVGLEPSDYEWLVIGNDTQGRPVMKPYLNIGDNLYEYRGVAQVQTETSQGEESVVQEKQMGIYTRTSELGYKEGRFRVKEYHWQNSGMESVFPRNVVGKDQKVEDLVRSLSPVKNEVFEQKTVFTSSADTGTKSDLTTAFKEADIDLTQEQLEEHEKDYRENYAESLTAEEFVEIIKRDC